MSIVTSRFTCRWRNGVETSADFAGLEFTPFTDGTAPANFGVGFFDHGGSATGDEGAKPVLETA
jgi:hypothetical protein